MAVLLITCRNEQKCGPWLSVQFSMCMVWYGLSLLLPVIVIPFTMTFFRNCKTVPQND